MNKRTECPICGSEDIELGDYNEHLKTGPDCCHNCYWIESNGTESYEKHNGLVKKCFELQVEITR